MVSRKGRRKSAKKLRVAGGGPQLSENVQSALSRFIEYHPPARFSRHLRKMFLEFLQVEGADEGLYFRDLIFDLEGLFELLDVLENERQADVQG